MPVHDATVDVPTTEIRKLLRAWGWRRAGATARNHEKWIKNGVTIGIRRGGKMSVTKDVIKQAASVEGSMSVTEWLAGPPDDGSGGSVPQVASDDLDWFLDHAFTDLDDEEDKTRYRRIRQALIAQGTLDQYLDVKNKRQAEAARKATPNGKPTTTPTPEPAPAKPTPTRDPDSFTLTDVLAMRGSKLNQLGVTAAKIIMALHAGEIRDIQGRATRTLYDRLPNPPGNARGITAIVAEFADVGVIDREVHGKRTNRLALAVPLDLTDEERRWCADNGIDAPTEAPRTPSAPTPPPEPHEDPPAPPTDDTDATRPAGDDATPPHMNPAIDTLQATILGIQQRIDELVRERDGLVAAIDVLRAHGGDT